MAIELYATAGSVEKDLRNHVVIVVDVLRSYLKEMFQMKQAELSISQADLETALDFFACGTAGLLLMLHERKKVCLHPAFIAFSFCHFPTAFLSTVTDRSVSHVSA